MSRPEQGARSSLARLLFLAVTAKVIKLVQLEALHNRAGRETSESTRRESRVSMSANSAEIEQPKKDTSAEIAKDTQHLAANDNRFSAVAVNSIESVSFGPVVGWHGLVKSGPPEERLFHSVVGGTSRNHGPLPQKYPLPSQEHRPTL